MPRVVWSWEMGMAHRCRWRLYIPSGNGRYSRADVSPHAADGWNFEDIMLLGVPVSSFQGDNIPSRKLQSGGSRATWTHIPLLLCFSSAFGDHFIPIILLPSLQQDDRFQCCHLGHEEMLRGLPDEKLAKLHLQRDKLYLLLASDSQAWACLTGWTPLKARKPCWRMKFLFVFWVLMIRDKILFACIGDLHQTPITTPSRKTLQKKSSGTHSSRTICLSRQKTHLIDNPGFSQVTLMHCYNF